MSTLTEELRGESRSLSFGIEGRPFNVSESQKDREGRIIDISEYGRPRYL